MNNQLLKAWLHTYSLSIFFQDLPQWRDLVKQCTPLLESAVALTENDDSLTREYNDLFKGTHADITIPLWASACRDRGNRLLDKTTLEVIRFYKQWGYQSVDMDGNPPDYIGQLLRFSAYLLSCGLHGAGACTDAHRDFSSRYLAPVCRAVAGGIREHSATPLFLTVADLLETGPSDSPLDERQRAAILALLEASPWADSYRNGPNPPIPVADPREVLTAGRNNCGGRCVIRITEQEGCVLETGTDKGLGNPPLKACIRGRAYAQTYLNGSRLRYPMKRVGKRGEGRFERITWDEAADITASQWKRIRDTYGPGSRYVNYATGVSAVIRPHYLARRLLNLDGGYLGYYNSYSSACSRYVTPYIYGDNTSGNSMEDILNTKLLILWGHNPLETIFGTGRSYYLGKLKAKGVPIIVIDPRQSDTAVGLAAQWIGIRPSTDSALADAMAYVILSEGLQDQAFMDTFCLGFDRDHMPDGYPMESNYQDYLFGLGDGVPKTPQWGEAVTGVPADTIVKLARQYATTKPACLLPGLGPQRTGNGEQTVRSLAMLACLTGNVGIPGGGAAGAGALKGHKNFSFPTLDNPFPGKIPVFLWTKAVEDPHSMTPRQNGLVGVDRLETGIKMILNLAGNTLINQHSDINHTVRILSDPGLCQFILCSDVFMTPSARFADVLLPAPSFLEEENIVEPWEYGTYLLCNNPVRKPLFGCRSEYEFFREVARRLDLLEPWDGGHESQGQWLEALYEELRSTEEPELPPYPVFQEKGGHQYAPSAPYIAYAENIRDPQAHPFATPSGKIEIFSPALYDLESSDIPPIPRYTPCPEGPEDALVRKYPLQLIGWHTKKRCHSIHEGNQQLEEMEPHQMWMHPDDAEIRGICENDQVEVFNDRGRVRIPARITRRIVKGVVAISQGTWYTPGKDGTDVRGSINVLTSMRPTPLAKGNAQHTNLVQVSRSRNE